MGRGEERREERGGEGRWLGEMNFNFSFLFFFLFFFVVVFWWYKQERYIIF